MQSDALSQSIITKEVTKIDRQLTVFIPPIVDWSFLFQMPQHIARQFAKNGYKVIYCNQTQSTKPVVEIEPNLFIYCSFQQAIFDNPNPDLFYSSFAQPFKYYVNQLNPKLTIFHNCDGFKEWEKDDKDIISFADIVLFSSKPLYELHKNSNKNSYLVRNACDFDVCNIPHEIPKDLAKIKSNNKPIVFFQGAIGRWVNTDLMRKIPDKYSLVIVGKEFGQAFPKNAHFLGERTHDELMAYIQHSDVCILPFDKSGVSYYSSPIKTYEFLACGKIVVSTNIPESKYFQEGVLIAKSEADFNNQIDRALRMAQDPKWADKCKDIAKQNTWSHRFEIIEKAIKEGGKI